MSELKPGDRLIDKNGARYEYIGLAHGSETEGTFSLLNREGHTTRYGDHSGYVTKQSLHHVRLNWLKYERLDGL